MFTIKEIAKLTGVSRGTVDRVVNNRPGVKPETAKRVRLLMEELEYRPNAAGKMLAARKKKLRIAFLVVHGPEFIFFADVLSAAREQAESLRGLGVSVDFYLIRQFDTRSLNRLLREVEESAPDGIAALPLRIVPFVAFVERMNAKGVPVIYFNLDEDYAERLCYVGCDYVQSGRVAAGLCALCCGGEGKIGVATYDDANAASFTARMGGFHEEMHQYSPKLTLADGGTPAVFKNGNFSAVEALLSRHPDMNALYLVNLGDFSACRAVRKAARDRNFAIITNDLIADQSEMLVDGTISATISQRPDLQGAMPLQILYEYLVLGKKPSTSTIYTDLNIHISQNV